MTQKILTIYGDRGWNPPDPDYCENSIVRGFESLNEIIQTMSEINNLKIHSLSYSNILRPTHEIGGTVLTLYATLIYSGDITNIDGFPWSDDMKSSVRDWKQHFLKGNTIALKAYL
ncbi:hypothetical protein [Anabaena sp. CCY 9910]|uniref:hypothetical protein n=1 Tax=Anabaena sp. CCY 9910 TaxID=3103870 RepID=UPI0039DFBF93